MSTATPANRAAPGYGLHTPERHPAESMAQYRARQLASRNAAMRMIQGTRIRPLVGGDNRRHHIKAMGGIRQFKRARSAHLRAARDAARAA